MNYKTILLAILSIFFYSIGYGGEELFTWKDAQGGLHITDERPPDGAEILDISPTNIKTSKEEQLERQISRENIRKEKIRRDKERAIREKQAAENREKQIAAQKKNEEVKKAKLIEKKDRKSRRRRKRHRRFHRRTGTIGH